MRVISVSNSRYNLLDLVTHKEKVYHTSDMKPSLYDSTVTDPPDAVRVDLVTSWSPGRKKRRATSWLLRGRQVGLTQVDKVR